MRALFAFFLALAPTAPAAELKPGLSSWGSKSVGILLLGEDRSAEWDKTLAETRKALGGRYPIEEVLGLPSSRELQQSLNRLEAAGSRKIAVIPLRLSSRPEELAQIRYMLGFEQFPPRALSGPGGPRVVQRVKSKVPLVPAPSYEEDGPVAEALARRVLELSREPAKESVFLLAQSPGDPEAQERLSARLDAMAGKLARAGRFASVRAAVAPFSTQRALRDDSESWRPDLKSRGAETVSGMTVAELRGLIQAESRKGKVLVLPYLLAQNGDERMMRRSLEGLFFQWRGKGILYDERVPAWILKKAEEAARQPDGVRYKDAGKALPKGAQKIVP